MARETTELLLPAAVGAGTGALPRHAPDEPGVIHLTEAERAEVALVEAMEAPWLGDLDGIVARGFSRIGCGLSREGVGPG